MTWCVPARRTLAQGTIALWQEIDIYQDYEEVTRLVNLLEHGAYLTSEESRRALFQFLHHIYHTTPTTFASREIEYVAAMSSIVFDYDNLNKIDVRTYKFLINMLTRVEDLVDEVGNPAIALGYATETLGLDWNQYDPSLYSIEVQNIISVGATRTFGSSEFNNLTDSSQTQLITARNNGSGGWTAYFGVEDEYDVNDDLNITTGVSGAPFGVFLMTPDEFNFAQGLPKR